MNLLWVALLAASPISECRGSIPIGLAAGYDPLLVFSVSYIFNVLAGFLFLHLLDFVKLRKLVLKIFGKSLRKKLEFAKKYENLGEALLVFFVAIPFPLTGAYTGAFIAHALNFDRMKTFTAIALGVLIACIIVTLASLGVLSII